MNDTSHFDTSTLTRHGYWLREHDDTEDYIEDNGCTTERWFSCFSDRYLFDLDLCARSKGWVQYDTEHDFSHFGLWVNVSTLQVVCFAEGDLTISTFTSKDTLRKELAEMQEFYGNPPPAMIGLGLDGSVTHYYDDSARPVV